MSTVTVKTTRTRLIQEPATKTFPSKADPPVKCCRCFPSCVNKEGWCGCCEFNHATGEQPPPDPDYGL